MHTQPPWQKDNLAFVLTWEGMERESAPSAALGRVCPGVAADGVDGEADGAGPEYMLGE